MIQFHSHPTSKNGPSKARSTGSLSVPSSLSWRSRAMRGRKLWVLYAADGEYRLGAFDGHRFQPETGKLRLWHGNFYASQTFSDTPDGRRIQIGWGNGIAFPGEAFNQQMAVPCELTLRPTSDGVRLFAGPVAELASLRGKEYVFDGSEPRTRRTGPRGPRRRHCWKSTSRPKSARRGLHVECAAEPPWSTSFQEVNLACGEIAAPLAPEGRLVRLRILLDRGSIEVFGNDGRVAISRAFTATGTQPALTLAVPAASPLVVFRSIRIHELHSAWR